MSWLCRPCIKSMLTLILYIVCVDAYNTTQPLIFERTQPVVIEGLSFGLYKFETSLKTFILVLSFECFLASIIERGFVR